MTFNQFKEVKGADDQDNDMNENCQLPYDVEDIIIT